MQSLDQIRKRVQDKYEKNGHLDRFTHILGVEKMALYLAGKYHVDPVKAQIAALMHDYYKYEPEEELMRLIDPADAEECRKFPVLLHSYASAEAYLEMIGHDEDIYQAIRNHVFGRLQMSKLEEIILIADYTEEGRTYPSCIECRKILLEGKLYQAIYRSTLFTIEFLEKKHLIPHPLQYAVLEYYRNKEEGQ